MTRHQPLPDFADQWMAQWRRAARELPRIRDEQLRKMEPSASLVPSAIVDVQPTAFLDARISGLVIQQRWFMRQRLLQLEATKG